MFLAWAAICLSRSVLILESKGGVRGVATEVSKEGPSRVVRPGAIRGHHADREDL